ncbi:MAG: hypothetical protein ACFFC6_15200 [Promethearchaeota archaeon]
MRDVIHTLAEARKQSDYYLIIEEDYGYEIVVVCPVKLIKCTEEYIEQLQYRLNNFLDVGIFYIPKIEGKPFYSVSISVMPSEEIWINPRYPSLRDEIIGVLTNEEETIEKYNARRPQYERERERLLVQRLVGLGEDYFYGYEIVRLDDVTKFLMEYGVKLTESNIIELQKQINLRLKTTR